MKLWKAVRVPLMVVLLASAVGAHAWRLGRASGIREQIGGPGKYKTALVEWQDMEKKKVVVCLNDGANGYAFWIQLAPQFRHYTHGTKVFVAEYESNLSIKSAMDAARTWCAEDLEGGDTRITGGDLKPRADDGDTTDEADKNKLTHEEIILLAEREEYFQLRKSVNDQALLIQKLQERIARAEEASAVPARGDR
jgi:hypothetical protein